MHTFEAYLALGLGIGFAVSGFGGGVRIGWGGLVISGGLGAILILSAFLLL
ncbi:MAG TPA: hypothetical protein VGR51_05215 [Thermoplasmata archaeon]|jgi:hypothetical protein|nr:hypothetical protein [Thermoplasmata archaeon]